MKETSIQVEFSEKAVEPPPPEVVLPPPKEPLTTEPTTAVMTIEAAPKPELMKPLLT